MSEFQLRSKLLQHWEACEYTNLKCYECSKALFNVKSTDDCLRCKRCFFALCKPCLTQNQHGKYKEYKWMKCPECKQEFSFNSPINNETTSVSVHVLLKAIFSELPTRCEFAKYGCKEIFVDKNDLKKHEKDCLFYEINCASHACHKKFGAASYLDHFEKIHKNSTVEEKNDASFNLEVVYSCKSAFGEFFPRKCVAFDRSFFVTGGIVGQFLQLSVLLLGPWDEAKNFLVEIIIQGNDTVDMIKHTGSVYPMTLSLSEISKKFPFSCHMESLFDLSKDTSKIQIELKLSNLKDEAKKDDAVESGVSDVE